MVKVDEDNDLVTLVIVGDDVKIQRSEGEFKASCKFSPMNFKL